jgi:hypothetical protein
MTRLNNKLQKKSDGMGNNKTRADALDRIAVVEQQVIDVVNSHNDLAKATHANVVEINNRLDDIYIILQAISQMVGVDKVNEKSKEIRIAVVENEAKENEAAVAKALADGTLVKAETVTAESLVVMSIKKLDGSVTYPTKTFVTYAGIKPELQSLVLGKKVGETVVIPENNNTLEILDIYVEVVKEPSAPPAS